MKVHPAGQQSGQTHQMAQDASQRTYLKSKDKYRALEQDYVLTRDGNWRTQERLKLRVASRGQLPPIVSDPNPRIPRGTMVRPQTKDREHNDIQDSENAYGPTTIITWPPDDAPQALHDLLCPGGKVGELSVMVGDGVGGMVFTAGPPNMNGERPLVFVSFDPTFGFLGMKRLDGTAVQAQSKSGLLGVMRKRKREREDGNTAHTGERKGCGSDPRTT